MNRAIAVFTSLAAVLGLTHAAAAQDYPNRAVRLIVSSSAGSATDIAGRAIANQLQQRLGQPFVVENIAGANGTLGAETVSRAEPDGYTLLLTFSGVITTNPYVTPEINFDPLTELVPVAPVAETQLLLLVHPSFPADTFEEFVEYARNANPPVTYSSGGLANASFRGIERLKAAADIDLLHISYAGATPATLAAVSGEVMVTMSGSSAAQYIDSGALKALAVTGPERMEQFPDLPALNEYYDGLVETSWQAVFAPPGTPEDIVALLADTIIETRDSPEVLASFAAGAQFPSRLSREEFAAAIQEEYAAMGELFGSLDLDP